MTSFNVATPVTTALVVALCLSAGCASTPPSPLQQARNEAIRRLTLQCYGQMEGERLVMGGWQVHSICHQWAQQRVEVYMPPDVRMALD